MNSITLVGRAGTDPESQVSQVGMTIAKFRLAVDRGRKDRDGNKLTDWFTVKAFGKTAETIVDYVTKGKQVGITGAMVNEEYTNREGQKRDYWCVQVEKLVLMGGPEGANRESGDAEAPVATRPASRPAPAPSNPGVDEEIPF